MRIRIPVCSTLFLHKSLSIVEGFAHTARSSMIPVEITRKMDTSAQRAKAWTEIDPNEKTKSYVQSLLDTCGDSQEELLKLFPIDGSRLGFGTAGLRSAMEPGPLGMNDLVIVQTAQGLAKYCQQVAKDKDQKLLAVIGYDHRANPHLDLSSKSFAILTKMVFLEAGFECILFDGYVATPHVAYAVTKLDAAVGVMVTASHNPKDDAGFKVYWSDGCQIRSPIDRCIAQSILEESNLKPWTDYGQKLNEYKLVKDSYSDECFGLGNTDITKTLVDDYYKSILSSGLVIEKGNIHEAIGPTLRVAYTAMHGIGHKWAVKSYETFGLEPFLSVPEQQEPDFMFSTVPFPNPEEDGALSKAMDFADKNDCDLILANDPDADRLAVAEKCRITKKWTTFSGDQIGVMLGLQIWETIGKNCGKPVAMCASTVSSKMLATIAEAEGFYFEDTLTGFKWIGSRLLELRKEGYRSLFGYEEAIGFCCGDVIADKDGLAALGVMTQLANSVYAKGGDLVQHMASLYDKYGQHCSYNGYYFCHQPKIIKNILEDMRNNGQYMTHVGKYEIESIRDLGYPGYDSTTEDKKPKLAVSKSSPMMTIRFKNNTVAHFRGSGTEPKFKYYIEMSGKPGVKRDVVMQELKEMSDFILEELLHPTTNGMISNH